jgi:hypothetical protein
VAKFASDALTEKWNKICYVRTDTTSIKAFILEPRYEHPLNTSLSDFESSLIIKLLISVALNNAYEFNALSAEMLVAIVII